MHVGPGAGLTAPMSGLPPAPRPRVSFVPICTLLPPGTGDVARACSHGGGDRGMGQTCHDRVFQGRGPCNCQRAVHQQPIRYAPSP